MSWKFNDKDVAIDIVRPSQRNKVVSVKDENPYYYKNRIGNKKLHDANFATLTTALAKLHQEIYEPVVHTTYQTDVEVNVGGGFVEMVSYYSVDWYGVVNNTLNLGANNSNITPRVSAPPIYAADILDARP